MENEYIVNFVNPDKKEIENAMRNLSKAFSKCLSIGNFEDMENLFNNCKQMRYSAQAYLEQENCVELDKDILVNIGYARAILDSMKLWIEERKFQERMENLSEIKRRILFELYKCVMMSRKEISNRFGIDEEKVNGIISDINKEDISVIKQENVRGKEIYTITPRAHKYISEKYRIG